MSVLLIVAIRTDQPNIERRLRTILAASEPTNADTEPCAWAKPVEDLVAADLDALAALIGWDAVSRLRVGNVVSGGASYSLAETGSGDAPDSPDTSVRLLNAARRVLDADDEVEEGDALADLRDLLKGQRTAHVLLSPSTRRGASS